MFHLNINKLYTTFPYARISIKAQENIEYMILLRNYLSDQVMAGEVFTLYGFKGGAKNEDNVAQRLAGTVRRRA